MRIRLPWILIAASLTLAACGAAPAPATSTADVRSTAAAMALTFVMETQLAAPTSTPTLVPPTETLSPTSLPPTEAASPTALLSTDTPLPLPTVPTLQPTSTTAPVVTVGPNPCYSSTKRIPPSPAGRPTRIQINNSTRASITLTIYLNETPHGECGYRAYIMSALGTIVITDLVQGCYNLWARSSDPSTPVNAASPTSCINSPSTWTFQIEADRIKFPGL